MISRKSSGSWRAARAVEPTRSQNITVSCRVRHRPVPGHRGTPLSRRRGLGAERGNGVEELSGVASEHHAEILEILRRQLRQRLPIDLVVVEGRHIALKAQTL